MTQPGVAIQPAQALGGHLPPLLVAAKRVAATVAQGVHGRRQVGQGDSFWQYRPFYPGDPTGRIDWRVSARSDRVYVRQTEWEAAQTVCLWRDAGPAMRWKSRGAVMDKADRSGLLLLALAALLLRGGERVRLIGGDLRPVSGIGGLARLAESLARMPDTTDPLAAPLPRHASVVLFGDFLGKLTDIEAQVTALASRPAGGTLVQVLDPAEVLLPYEGRVRFDAVLGQDTTLVPRVEGVRAAYAERLAAQQHGLAALCATVGWRLVTHRTDHSAESALLALYTALGGEARRR